MTVSANEIIESIEKSVALLRDWLKENMNEPDHRIALGYNFAVTEQLESVVHRLKKSVKAAQEEVAF